MPRWPVKLLLKLFADPRVTIGGAVATAEIFLPFPDHGPSIVLGHAHARSRTRRRAQNWRRRLES
jgi:hypothetical protein